MSHPIAAIDIGSSLIRTVAGEIRDDKINLIARSSAAAQGIRNGFLTNKIDSTIAIKKAIRLTEKQIGYEINEVYVTADGGPLSTRVISSAVAVSHGDGHVTEFDITAAVRRSIKKSLGSNQRNVDHIVLGYKLDGVETVSEPLGMRGKKLEVNTMLFNYASQNMDAIEDVLDSLDVSIAGFFPAIIGSSIVSLTAIDRKVGCILIDIGSDTTSYVVYEQDSPLQVGHIEEGSDSITQAIALNLQIAVSEAELIKHGGPLPEGVKQTQVDQIIKKSTQEIFKKINIELKGIGKQGNLPGGAILCGGGALVKNIEEIAKQVLKIPTRKAGIRAFRRDGAERELVWSSAYGVAINAMEQVRSEPRNPLAKITKKLWQGIRKFSV